MNIIYNNLIILCNKLRFNYFKDNYRQKTHFLCSDNFVMYRYILYLTILAHAHIDICMAVYDYNNCLSCMFY